MPKLKPKTKDEPHTWFEDRCKGKGPTYLDLTHCGAVIRHRVRTQRVDERIHNETYLKEKVYTAANRPRYSRCYECAAKVRRIYMRGGWPTVYSGPVQ